MKNKQKTLDRIRSQFQGFSSLVLEVVQTKKLPGDYKQRMGVHFHELITFLERQNESRTQTRHH